MAGGGLLTLGAHWNEDFKAVCIISWTMNYQVQCDSFQIWFASLHLTVRECVFPHGHTHAPMPFFLTT